MRIRFLQTTASARPGYPFVAGQVIDVAEPTEEMLVWLEVQPDGTRRAEVVANEAPVAAVEPRADLEQAVRPRATRRRADVSTE
jgi:hypothetical protein